MLSFGIEFERAFSIAFWSARFPPGSGPPSFAATMIARDSFEKSLPRFASAAPFLCLMEDHLLCPDMQLLHESLVDARIFRQLRMKCGGEEPSLPHENRLAVVLGKDLDLRPDIAHARRADEHPAKRPLVIRELEIGFEARDLAPVRVPF